MRSFLLKLFAAALAAMALQASAQPLPKLDLQDLQGGHHKLEDYKGKVIVLNFWATYCVPCVVELPLLNEMQRKYKDKIIVLAASLDDELDRDKLQPFLHKHDADDLTLFIGASFETLEDFGLAQVLPGTIFIDAEGKIVGKVEGALKRDDLEHRLAKMTGTPEKPKAQARRRGPKTR
ncbi:MAG: TlpA family protein disulfide reductase [Terriglobales bacterium]